LGPEFSSGSIDLIQLGQIHRVVELVVQFPLEELLLEELLLVLAIDEPT
jgi:hypothetical protein